MTVEFTREKGGFIILPFVGIQWETCDRGFLLIAWGQWFILFKSK